MVNGDESILGVEWLMGYESAVENPKSKIQNPSTFGLGVGGLWRARRSARGGSAVQPAPRRVVGGGGGGGVFRGGVVVDGAFRAGRVVSQGVGGAGGRRAEGFFVPPAEEPEEEPKEERKKEEKAEPTEEATKEVLFDIIMDLIKSKIFVDEDLNVKITLVNFGVPGKVNVSLYYEILDLENNVILIENETRTVETQIEFIKTFKLPPTVKLGDYKLSAKLIFGDSQEAISQSSFQIVSKEKQWPALIIFTLLVAFGLYILITRLKKKNKK